MTNIDAKKISIGAISGFIATVFAAGGYMASLQGQLVNLEKSFNSSLSAHTQREEETFRRYDERIENLKKNNDTMLGELRDMRNKIDKIYELIVSNHK